MCGNTSSKEWDISKGKRKKYVETWGNGKWKTKYERMKEKVEKEGKIQTGALDQDIVPYLYLKNIFLFFDLS